MQKAEMAQPQDLQPQPRTVSFILGLVLTGDRFSGLPPPSQRWHGMPSLGSDQWLGLCLKYGVKAKRRAAEQGPAGASELVRILALELSWSVPQLWRCNPCKKKKCNSLSTTVKAPSSPHRSLNSKKHPTVFCSSKNCSLLQAQCQSDTVP